MKRNKPLALVAGAALLTLAACGGGSSDDGDTGSGADREFGAQEGGTKDAERQGPAADIDGASAGGTITVYLPSDPGPDTLDPSGGWSVTGNSIQQALTSRSLTQYARGDDGEPILVPDLATDLGTANEDFTEWTFTIREDATWEDGKPVTAEEVAFGICRSLDSEAFPSGPGTEYSKNYFADAADYEGPYTAKDPNCENYDAIAVDGQDITISMAKPFPDMPYWAAFPAIGPIPEGKASNPATYAQHPLATGPYMFDKYTPEKSLTLVKNPEWDPATDPGRHQYVDGFDMQFDTPTAKIDQIMLADQGDAQDTLTYDNVSVSDYLPFTQDSNDRLVTGSVPCTAYWAPDYRKIKDIKVRQALAYAYPYADVYSATGLIPDVTRVYGTNLMPPGVPGREEYNPLPDHEPGTTDPDKARALLKEAGEEGFEIKFLYATDDPLSVDGKDQIVKGLEAAGFKATPVATTVAQLSTVRADPDADINVRSAGWCSDWPSGASWFPPVLGSTNLDKEGLGSNYAVFSEKKVDDQISDILSSKIEDQPAMWNELDQSIATDYFPLFVTGYYGAAMMRGSNVNGFLDDTVFGMPTWKDMWLTQ